MTKNIFMYWTGKTFKLIDKLRELALFHSNNNTNFKLHLLNDKNIREYIEISNNFENLIPAHKADYIRVKVINKYGGIWLDSDTIVMNNLKELFDIFNNYDGFFILENNNVICNGVFASKPGTDLMKKWETHCDSEIKKSSLKWSDIGSKFLNQNISMMSKYKIFRGLDNLYPIYYPFCVEFFLNSKFETYKKIIREFQPVIILVNSVYKKYETMEDTDKCPIHYFLEKSKMNT